MGELKMFGKRVENRYGIDLGTSNTLIYQKGEGVILCEPSVVAIRTETGEVTAVGAEAEAMIGRTPDAIEIVFPIKDGVIADQPITLTMLRHFIGKVAGKRSLTRLLAKPEYVVTVPFGIDSVKRRAVENTIRQMGANKVTTIEEPLAAGMGSGLPVDEPVGSMVINIGGGRTQSAILSLGGLVVGHTLSKAGNSIDAQITEYVKNKHNLMIGKRTAEAIKQRIGTAMRPDTDETMEIRGRYLIDGLPRSMVVSTQEIHGLLDDFVGSLVDSVRFCLETCPPELVGDILERGIMLCGGGSLLHGLNDRLQAEIDVPVFLAEKPLECIAIGAGRVLG